MKKTASRKDDDGALRKATRVLSEVKVAVGAPGRPPGTGKNAAAPIDRRRLAAMRAEVEAQRIALCERRDRIGAELDIASRRVAAVAAYMKCDTLSRTPASRSRSTEPNR